MSFSPDGHKVAFSGYGEPDVTTGTRFNIYLYDIAANTNFLVTRSVTAPYPSGGNADSWIPRFSPDGKWLSFYSGAYNIATNLSSDFYWRLWAWDVEHDLLRVIGSRGSNAVFSPNSHWIGFTQYTPGTSSNVYLATLTNDYGMNILVANHAIHPALSRDAEYVAYQRLPGSGQMTDIIVKNRTNGTVQLASVAWGAQAGANDHCGPPQITPDGRFVVYSSKASNLVANDTNGFTDVFLRDRQLGLTYLVSANSKTGRSGNGPSANPVLSADGSTVVFSSMASDLIDGDYNDKQDIFVVKLTSGDSDADGLDDAWEMAYFGNLNRDGSGDFDGDGLTDREEFRAGTDPTNQGSVLRALVMSSPGSRQATLMWPASNTAQYKVQYKRSLTDADWTDLETAIAINGNTATATDPAAGLESTRFYRIMILP
jgi:Tol biopolymer transport system component